MSATNSIVRSRLRLGTPLIVAGCVVVAALFAFPVFFMVTSSFKLEPDIMRIPIKWLPDSFFDLRQYALAAEIAPIWTYLGNSILISVINVLFTCFFSALAGYGFAKFEFPGRTLLFYFVISTMMIPFQILVVPLFVEVHAFGWANSYVGLIVPGIMNAFGVFMMRQYVADIPDALIEAGRVDGAGELRIFIELMLPLLRPPLASLAIIIFIWSWGNFLWPLIVTQDRDMTVLAVGLTNYSQPFSRQPMWGAAMAASTIATLPIAAIFILFQRHFIQGLTAAAVKG